MKKVLFASILFTSALSFAQSSKVTLWGVYPTNAAILTEDLLARASSDSSIVVDTSVYTITKVSREDKDSTIACSRSQFSGPPATYSCTITNR